MAIFISVTDDCEVHVFNNVGVHFHTAAQYLITYKGKHTTDRGHFHCNDKDTALAVGRMLATLHA